MTSQHYQISPKLTYENINGEVIMLDIEQGLYFSLQGTGAQVWDGIEKQQSLADIINTIATHYSVDATTVADGVNAFINQLCSLQLLSTTAAPISTPAWEIIRDSLVYKAPVLQTYNDLQDLIMIDPIHDTDATGWPHQPNHNTETA